MTTRTAKKLQPFQPDPGLRRGGMGGRGRAKTEVQDLPYTASGWSVAIRSAAWGALTPIA